MAIDVIDVDTILVRCIYCGAAVKERETVPDGTDDAAWAALADEHEPTCEWIKTRAHRI